jgi:hypothetical protein
MQRSALILALGGLSVIACHPGGSMTQPAANPAAGLTRLIALEGDLNFGDVPLNSSPTKTIRIVNRGTGAIRVTGFMTPRGSGVCQEPGDPDFCPMVASWTEGEIAASGSQDVTVRLDLRMVESWSGTFTVLSNHSGGTNTLLLTARGVTSK